MLCDSPEESCGERWGDLYSSVYDNVFVIKDSNQLIKEDMHSDSACTDYCNSEKVGVY